MQASESYADVKAKYLRLLCEICIYIILMVNVFVLMTEIQNVCIFLATGEGPLAMTELYSVSVGTGFANMFLSAIAIGFTTCFYIGIVMNKIGYVRMFKVFNGIYLMAGLIELIVVAAAVSSYLPVKYAIIFRLLFNYFPTCVSMVLVMRYLDENDH